MNLKQNGIIDRELTLLVGKVLKKISKSNDARLNWKDSTKLAFEICKEQLLFKEAIFWAILEYEKGAVKGK